MCIQTKNVYAKLDFEPRSNCIGTAESWPGASAFRIRNHQKSHRFSRNFDQCSTCCIELAKFWERLQGENLLCPNFLCSAHDHDSIKMNSVHINEIQYLVFIRNLMKPDWSNAWNIWGIEIIYEKISGFLMVYTVKQTFIKYSSQYRSFGKLETKKALGIIFIWGVYKNRSKPWKEKGLEIRILFSNFLNDRYSFFDHIKTFIPMEMMTIWNNSVILSEVRQQRVCSFTKLHVGVRLQKSSIHSTAN